MSTETLPESITAMRTVTYDVRQIIEDLAECHDKKEEEITLADVVDYIHDLAIEDLATSRMGIIFQDENGGEIDL